jgi:hypothetical protein
MMQVRPPLPRELEGGIPYQPVIKVASEKEIILHENLLAYENGADDPQYRSHTFAFDRVYDQV